MNNTEAEARRLLTTGVSDRPAAIDLLDGFTCARARTRRRQGRAVLSAGVAVTAAAVTAIALTVGSTPSALAAVTTALNHTLNEQSYHSTEVLNFYTEQKGNVVARYDFSCTIEAAPAQGLGEYSCTNGVRSLQVGGYFYQNLAFPQKYPGKPWRQFKAGSSLMSPVGTDDALGNATPQQILSDIEKTGKVTVLGPVSGPGWTGTRYAFTIHVAPKTPVRGLRTLSETFSGTVDVDQQGRARALVLTTQQENVYSGSGVTYSMTFGDFGARVKVTLPPANETYTLPPLPGP
jgi:hypothetical protein